MRDYAIVNFAQGSWYPNGQARLLRSLNEHAPGVQFFGFNDYNTIDSPDHRSCPYGFKIHAIEYALAQGYRKILWVDASVWATGNMDHVWRILELHGVLLINSGFLVKDWTNDKALNYFKIVRKDAGNFLMPMGGFFGIDFSTSKGKDFFGRLKAAKNAGAFLGSWVDHRHDMSSMGIIMNQMKIPLINHGEIVRIVGNTSVEYTDSVCFDCQGM
jgi:hypothetical protein